MQIFSPDLIYGRLGSNCCFLAVLDRKVRTLEGMSMVHAEVASLQQGIRVRLQCPEHQAFFPASPLLCLLAYHRGLKGIGHLANMTIDWVYQCP